MSSTPEVLRPLLTTGERRADAALPDPALLHLLLPKWLTARARTVQGEKGRGARYAILAFVGLLFWGFVFGVLYRLLTYFRGVEEIGALLAGKLLGLILLGFTSILLWPRRWIGCGSTAPSCWRR
jgi:hypothetical protein